MLFSKSHNPLKSNPSVYLAARDVISTAHQTSVPQTIESQFHGELATKEDRMYLGSNGHFNRRKLTRYTLRKHESYALRTCRTQVLITTSRLATTSTD
ncbi:unnamed protein product [Euphydryas editha]|uniref:Uncharacterized protein n=1 Tax=Euphydryas editha TaxID=104508 RepID=A0AAU9TGF7_EUPED|nr:unnamed protein product [Euphydryas editha]